MASSQMNETSSQCMTCRCGEGDKNFLTTMASENSDKQSINCPNCETLKCGPLFISSKGIGWTSWKKRWFVLSRKSLMFYRADPTLTLKGNEAPNPTLGGIELNNSGSVVAKQDKKLLTVLFSDGRDGRAFTLKTETFDELNEWKVALEGALAQAPSAAQVMGQNGIFRNEVADLVEVSVEQCKDKPSTTTTSIVGRPVLLALEDIDGSPSFLEKALSFIEEHGIKVEGILRQSADVEEVVHRVHEYEQGRNEFSSDEDAHVIGDCIKHLLREMPSSPVPASCCTALVDAYRTDRVSRVDNIRDAIYETFPEPNRRLLQRTLQMMLTVAAHKAENRMSLSALAACMAPLLLRPLLAGECELKNDFQMDGDGSFQLLQAAAAANHAQAIVIILLEEYEKIFDYESFSSELYTDSEDEDDIGDDESSDNDIPEKDGYHDAKNELKANEGGGPDHSHSGLSSGSCSDVGSEDGSNLGSDVGSDIVSDIGSDMGIDVGSDVDSDDTGSNVGSNGGSVVKSDAGSGTVSNLPRDKDTNDNSSHSISARDIEVVESIMTNSNKASTSPCEGIDLKPSTSSHVQSPAGSLSVGTADTQKDYDLPSEKTSSTVLLSQMSCEVTASALSTTATNKLVNTIPSASQITKFTELSKEAQPSMRNKWGRTSARKNLSMEYIEYISDDESAVQRLESDKIDLQTKILIEIEGNAVLQASLDRRKEALHERRSALEKDVIRLQEQLQKIRNLRSHLESGLMNIQLDLPTSACLDKKTRTNLEEISLSVRDISNLKQNIADLTEQLQQGHATLCESCGQPIYRNKKQENVGEIPYAQKSDNSLEHNENTISSGKSDSCTKDLAVGSVNPANKLACQNVNITFSADVDSKTQTRDSPSSKKKQRVFDHQQCWSNQDNNVSDIGGSKLEGNNAVKKPSSNTQNSLNNAGDSENLKDETKSSNFLGDMQSFQKLLPRLSNQGIARSSGVSSSSEDRRNAPKKAGKWDDTKKYVPVSSEEHIELHRNNATRRHAPKCEEAASSSSALTKLTNRLNFLKERRVQLANELHNLDPGRAVGSEAPSKTSSS